MNSRLFPQLSNKMLIEILLKKILVPLEAAESQEASPKSDVARSREANLLTRESHKAPSQARRLYITHQYTNSITT